MTNDGMTHDEARDALGALALDALDAADRAAVLAHVAECATCRPEFATLQDAAAELAYAVPPVSMSPQQRNRVRARLLARAAADSASRSSGAPVREAGVVPIGTAPSARAAATRGGRGATARWLAIAAGLIAVASVGTLVRVMRERDSMSQSLRVAAAAQGSRAVAMDSLRAAVADRESLIANLTGPQVAVMTLASSDPASPTARMFWDQAHDAWVFVGHNLQAPKAGRAYQLWLVTPTAKISAGTFVPGANGEAVLRATYALPKNSLAAVAVTDEPSAGSAQPTTAPFLVVASK